MSPNSLKIIGIIGARSGSKGLPDKNIRPLAGKPLMGWIIETAKKSKYLNRVFVSTDSEEYASLAKQYGAEVPCLRPAKIASDQSTDIEYLKHMVSWLREKEKYEPDMVLRLLPTCPLQLPEDIDFCIEKLLNDPDAHSAVVIAEARQHPQKALKLVADGAGDFHLVSYLTGKGEDVTPVFRQRYEKAYFRANIIASKIRTIDSLDSLTGSRVRCHLIPQERAIDIDSPMDFFIAEQIISKLKQDKKS